MKCFYMYVQLCLTVPAYDGIRNFIPLGFQGFYRLDQDNSIVFVEHPVYLGIQPLDQRLIYPLPICGNVESP